MTPIHGECRILHRLLQKKVHGLFLRVIPAWLLSTVMALEWWVDGGGKESSSCRSALEWWIERTEGFWGAVQIRYKHKKEQLKKCKRLQKKNKNKNKKS